MGGKGRERKGRKGEGREGRRGGRGKEGKAEGCVMAFGGMDAPGVHCLHQPLHHRVIFSISILRNRKKYELHLKSIISRVANSIIG